MCTRPGPPPYKDMKPQLLIIYWLDAETTDEGWAPVVAETGAIDKSLLVPSAGYIADKDEVYTYLAGDYDPATLGGDPKNIHYNRILKIPHGMIYDICVATVGKSIFKKKKK